MSIYLIWLTAVQYTMTFQRKYTFYCIILHTRLQKSKEITTVMTNEYIKKADK